MVMILNYTFCGLAVCLALGFALIRHPVHAALSFASVVLAAAGVYLMQDAPFIAAATVIIYAGATIIIFLFVLMFAQRTNLLEYDTRKQNLIPAGLAAIVLLAIVMGSVSKSLPGLEAEIASQTATGAVEIDPTGADAESDFYIAGEKQTRDTVAKLGTSLYTRYLLAVEIAGTLLLVAAVGAVVIAQRDGQEVAKEPTV